MEDYEPNWFAAKFWKANYWHAPKIDSRLVRLEPWARQHAASQILAACLTSTALPLFPHGSPQQGIPLSSFIPAPQSLAPSFHRPYRRQRPEALKDLGDLLLRWEIVNEPDQIHRSNQG